MSQPCYTVYTKMVALLSTYIRSKNGFWSEDSVNLVPLLQYLVLVVIWKNHEFCVCVWLHMHQSISRGRGLATERKTGPAASEDGGSRRWQQVGQWQQRVAIVQHICSLSLWIRVQGLKPQGKGKWLKSWTRGWSPKTRTWSWDLGPQDSDSGLRSEDLPTSLLNRKGCWHLNPPLRVFFSRVVTSTCNLLTPLCNSKRKHTTLRHHFHSDPEKCSTKPVVCP